jgi:MFS family permease
VKQLPALRERAFALLFAGQAVSMIGDALSPVALTFAVLDGLDGSPTDLGIVLGAEVLPMTVLVLVAGVLADRHDRRALMLVSDLGRAAVQIALATLLLTGSAELWHLVALSFAYGCFDAFFRPAAGGLVPQVVPPAHLQQANALLAMAQNVGIVLGPAAAGALIVIASPGAAVAVDAATFLVSAAFLTAMRSPPLQRREEAPRFLAELKGGFAEVRARRWLCAFMPAFSAYHLIALTCVLALGPVIADTRLGGAGAWATIVTAFGVGMIAGSAIGLRVQPRHPMRTATIAFVLGACQPIAIAYGGSTAVIAALEALLGVAVSIGFTQWDTSLGREIPPNSLSRITSLDWFTTVGLMPLGFAAAGPIDEAVGTQTTMLAASVLVVALFALALATRDVRELRAADRAEV